MVCKIVEMRPEEIAAFCSELSVLLAEKNFSERYNTLVVMLGCYIYSENVALKLGFSSTTWSQFMTTAEPLINRVLRGFGIEETATEKAAYVERLEEYPMDANVLDRIEKNNSIEAAKSNPVVIQRSNPSKLDS